MSDVDPAVWEEAMHVLQEMADGGCCPVCGQSLDGTCPQCDATIPDGANYCPGCALSVREPPAEDDMPMPAPGY
jgi:predicted amidophosphoribosyltransferase